MFKRFETLFLVAYHLHIFIYIIPLHVNLGVLRKDRGGALAACIASLGIVTIFRPYPTAVDFSVLVTLYFVFADIITKDVQRTLVLSVIIAFFGICMYPVMSVMWLQRNTGNANFMFFMQLLYQSCAALSLVEFIRAFKFEMRG